MLTLVVGTSVLVPSLRRSGLLLAGVLGVLFTSVQLTAVIRELNITCGCFDPFRSSEVSWGSVLLPLTLAIGSWCGFFMESHADENQTQT